MKKRKKTPPTLAIPQVNIEREIKDYRRELWVGVAISVASSSNCTNPTSMAKWADRALEDYDKIF
jgi:hypothetical protein